MIFILHHFEEEHNKKKKKNEKKKRKPFKSKALPTIKFWGIEVTKTSGLKFSTNKNKVESSSTKAKECKSYKLNQEGSIFLFNGIATFVGNLLSVILVEEH